METGTQLTVQQRASVALGAAEHEKKLIELAKQSTEIVAITNAAGYQQLHSARMVLKNERITLEKLGKAARDDATKFSRAVIEEEKRLIAIIEPEEKRLQAIQEEHDTRVEREKQAKIEAERLRVERIQAAIEEIKNVDSGLTIMSGSALVSQRIEDLQAEAIDERFAEFRQAAEQAKVLAMMRLNTLRDGALEYEAEQRRVIAEREELARMKAEEDKRQREAAAKEAEAIRKQAEADAEARRKIAEEERAARMRIEQQERDARLAREEADRKAREAREAEEARLKAERDRLDAEARALEERQRAEREAAEAKGRADREAEEQRLKAERDAAEAAQREIQRKADELLDARTMLITFSDRYGDIKEFSGVERAINAYFAKHGDPRRGEQAQVAA